MPGTEEPGGLQSTGLQRVGSDWMTKHRTPLDWEPLNQKPWCCHGGHLGNVLNDWCGKAKLSHRCLLRLWVVSQPRKGQKASSHFQPCLPVPSHALGGIHKLSKYNIPYNTVMTKVSIDVQGRAEGLGLQAPCMNRTCGWVRIYQPLTMKLRTTGFEQEELTTCRGNAPPGTGWHRACLLAYLSQTFMSNLASDPLLSTGKRMRPGRPHLADAILPGQLRNENRMHRRKTKRKTKYLYMWTKIGRHT